jgi:hypothetical protein
MVDKGINHLELTRAYFDNYAVIFAQNPDIEWGFAHVELLQTAPYALHVLDKGYQGPIPDRNPGWKPAAYHEAMARGFFKYDITAARYPGDPLAK